MPINETLRRLANVRHGAMIRKDREIEELKAERDALRHELKRYPDTKAELAVASELLRCARPFVTDRVNITYHDLRERIDAFLDRKF